jgi:HSP20 family protein
MTRSLRPWRGTGIRPLDDLYKEVDSLVQHFFGDEGSGNGTREFLPSINVAETDQGYEITVDLPGMKPEDVSVELHENQLTISGKREAEQEETGKRFHRVERRYGEFRRVITVPTPVDESKIAADYQQGVLKVFLPKSEKVKPTRIPIKT